MHGGMKRRVTFSVLSTARLQTRGVVRRGTDDLQIEAVTGAESEPVELDAGWAWYAYDVVEGKGRYQVIARCASTGRPIAISHNKDTRDGFLSRRFRFEVR